MNITHVEVNRDDFTGDRLEAIFNRQKELMAKYHDIELKSGLLQTEDCPVNINDKKGQARLKDFAWRMTEEIGEAIDSLYIDHDLEHYAEELIDALHFLTEFTILSGVEPKDLMPVDYNPDMGDMLTGICHLEIHDNPDGFREAMFTEHIRTMGMTCNCLKNKPWKQTMMLTDKANFTKHLKQVWFNFMALLRYEMSTDDIFLTYVKKSEVNKFRQRSNY